MLTLALIGLGSRGRDVYLTNFSKNSNIKISALCDLSNDNLVYCKNRYGSSDTKIFIDEVAFFEQGKLADALVISTLDKDHYRHAKKALELGYHLLLEKPITNSQSELEELSQMARDKNLKVLVCHVLRYAPFYLEIKKLLVSGTIGEIVTIKHTENVGYWHFAHSYTRGNWRNSATTAPSLLAKCCHDMDVFNWFIDKKPLLVSSFGSLKYFNKAHQPQGATLYCLKGCPHYDKCPYSVKNAYFKPKSPLYFSKKQCTGLSYTPTVKESKRLFINNNYGKCVYLCDNNVCDNQIVNIKYEDDITVSFMMSAFSKQCYRNIHIMGTKGEIFGRDIDNRFVVNIFGEKSKTVKINKKILHGHLGGDIGICNTFYQYLMGEKVNNDYLTTLEVSQSSHNIVYSAEKSRLENITVKI